MKTNNEIVFDCICDEPNTSEGTFGIEMAKTEFMPADLKALNKLQNSALTFMHKNRIMHMTVHMEDSFLIRNLL